MVMMPPLVTVMWKAAEAAAKPLSRDFGEVEQLQVSFKGPSDFVSAADRRAEQTLHKHLSKARPTFGFLMEESGVVAGTDPARRFIIDPLDGTNNFLHGLPHWCITLAAEEEGEITAALTFDIIRNETFWAAKGFGAFLGNRRLRVSTRKNMDIALLASGGPSKGRGDVDAYKRDVEKVFTSVSSVRANGSSALDLAYIAAGRLDGYWARDISPWDVAAGLLLIREAGGRVSEVNGGKDPLYGRSILATNGALYQDIHDLLN